MKVVLALLVVNVHCSERSRLLSYFLNISQGPDCNARSNNEGNFVKILQHLFVFHAEMKAKGKCTMDTDCVMNSMCKAEKDQEKMCMCKTGYMVKDGACGESV